MYHILTSKKKSEILCTKDLNECYEFITKHTDTKVRAMDHRAKPKIVNKARFVKSYFEKTEDTNKTFVLAEIMIKGKTNLLNLLNILGLQEEYKTYKRITNENL